MAYKTTSDIADLFFHEDRPSRLDTEDIWTHITWREWSNFLTAKQGNWLMSQAARENKTMPSPNGKRMTRGTFKRGETTYFYEATEVGKNKQVMLKISRKEIGE